jgi:hypothetical protein
MVDVFVSLTIMVPNKSNCDEKYKSPTRMTVCVGPKAKSRVFD